MENHADIQNQIFNKISDQLPSHISLVDEISEVLGISADSAYRRIRGEKPLSVYEVQKLCEKYQFSVDDLASTSINNVTFRANLLEEDNFSFSNYLSTILNNLQAFCNYEDAEIMFFVNELNLLQIIQVPEVFAFKLFFWQKSNLYFPGFRDSIFTFDVIDDGIMELISEIIQYYVKIKTIELTTEETLISLLKQILFYSEAGLFRTRNDAIKICEKLYELVDHLKLQAELGFKFPFGKKPAGKEGNFMFYNNDIILIDQIILVKAGDTEATFITNNGINLLQTFNKQFFRYNYEWGKNMIQKSTLISGSAEKERKKYFIQLNEKIRKVITQIS
ncbi:MAG: hypothetical protein JSV22_03365 [Bacteroidales bacterium]|nr:MAG: hypothetical protein JSV22_03365 [Bacteroidales bacterium]